MSSAPWLSRGGGCSVEPDVIGCVISARSGLRGTPVTARIAHGAYLDRKIAVGSAGAPVTSFINGGICAGIVGITVQVCRRRNRRIGNAESYRADIDAFRG